MSRPAASRQFDGDARFDERVLPSLLAQPFFLRASDEELTRSYAAYRSGDPAQLIDTWREIAEPTRATLGPVFASVFRKFRLLPKRINGLTFLATLRGVLAAGVRFRSRLRPATQNALRTEFPWLERRHQHIPPGYTPSFEFPPTFEQFIDGGDLDDARARWQLAAAFNEVQQTVFSDHLADLYGIAELHTHAERERELALSYLSHWSPNITESLFRQCVHHLDALNASVFQMTCGPEGPKLIARALIKGNSEWRSFIEAMDFPQWLLPLP